MSREYRSSIHGIIDGGRITAVVRGMDPLLTLQLRARIQSEYSSDVKNWRSILTIIVFLVASKLIVLVEET